MPGRIRTIKPSFFTSPDTARASVDARLLYIAMWCWADDWGVGEANMNALLGFAFPEDDQRDRKELQSLCKEVAAAYGVAFYEVRGRYFYEIPSWNDHQKTQRKAERRNPPSTDPKAKPDLRFPPGRGTSDATQGSSAQGSAKHPSGIGEQGNRGIGEQGNDISTVSPVTYVPERAIESNSDGLDVFGLEVGVGDVDDLRKVLSGTLGHSLTATEALVFAQEIGKLSMEPVANLTGYVVVACQNNPDQVRDWYANAEVAVK